MSYFAGFGHYLPLKIIDNQYLESRLNLPAGWIERRTGIRERRFAAEGETLVSMAEKAGLTALENANINPLEIGMVLLSTSTPDNLLPPTAPLLAYRLQLNNAGAFDLAGACCGFLYALTMADSFVHTHQKPALIVAANILSRRINFSECESAVIFGDAAGAVVIFPEKNNGIMNVKFTTDGSCYSYIQMTRDQSFMTLKNGGKIFSQAVEMMVSCSKNVLKKTDIKSITRFFPHQANARIMKLAAQKLGLESNLFSTVEWYGNSSAAGIPLNLSIANQEKPFLPGEKVLLTAAGAGMTGGAVLVSV